MRSTNTASIEPMNGSILMTVMTMGFYFATVVIGNITVAAIMLQSVAAVAAIVAGFSTLAYNAYRFYRDYKNGNQNKKE